MLLPCHYEVLPVLTATFLYIDLPEGEKLRLGDLQAVAQGANTYESLTMPQCEAMKMCLEEQRMLKNMEGSNRCNAHSHDVQSTCTAVHQEVSE